MQGRAVREPGQVFGAELLVHRDAEQIQLGRTQRHAQRHDREGGNEHQPAELDEGPMTSPAPQPADGNQTGQAADLPDGGQRVQLVGRRVGRPLHAGDRDQRRHRHDDGDRRRGGQLAEAGQCVTHG